MAAAGAAADLVEGTASGTGLAVEMGLAMAVAVEGTNSPEGCASRFLRE